MDKQTGHFFYVLLCKDMSLYGGYTNNLAKRLATHQAGKGAKYTRIKAKQPVHLLYAESWPDKASAMSQEYHFKQLSRLKKIDYLRQAGIQDLGQHQFIMVNKKGAAHD